MPVASTQNVPMTPTFGERLFVRIYLGTVLVYFLVIVFVYFVAGAINQTRLQTYREEMATGIMHVLGDGLSDLITQEERAYWLSDAENLFGDAFSILPQGALTFNDKENARLSSGKAVVRYQVQNNHTHIYYQLASQEILSMLLTQPINDRQVKAFSIFLLDDLSDYATLNAKNARLKEISAHFPFEITMRESKSLNLSPDQLGRLNAHEIVPLYKDGGMGKAAYITALAPSRLSGYSVVLGPIGLFVWTPIELIISLVAISLGLIGIATYGLIYPIQKRLKRIQAGVDQVIEGNLKTSVPVTGRDEIAKLATSFNAMTRHIDRLIEAQRELSRAVSHELRTPVARIRFGVEMLADTSDAKARMSQHAQIDEDIEALNDLINEILTYAKLEEGSPKLEFETFSLRALLEQVERETNALGKPIFVRIQAPTPKQKDAVVADRRYLHRVLQNLAGNALRYAKSEILIGAYIKGQDVYVSVEDDGSGIDPAMRKKVFVPFARLDDSRTRASGGYGLGLSIVARIAFWFHGEMSVDDSPSLGGARFMMRFPVRPLVKPISRQP